MNDVLAEIIAHKRSEVEQAKAVTTFTELEGLVAQAEPPRNFFAAVTHHPDAFHTSVIAEVKRLHKLGLSADDAAKQANWGPYKEWFLVEQQGPIAVRKIYEEIEGKLK